MVPQIKYTKDYVEYIGHYSDIKMCAKLSALASVFAVEVKNGYAKFPIEYKEKINQALQCELAFFTTTDITYDNNTYTYNKVFSDDNKHSLLIWDINSLSIYFYYDGTYYSETFNNYERVRLGFSNSGLYENKAQLVIEVDDGIIYANYIDSAVNIVIDGNYKYNLSSGSFYDDSLPNINDSSYLEYDIWNDSYISSFAQINILNNNIPEPSDPIETSIKIGTKSLADASVGTTKLLKAYIGNHLIFERLGSNFLTSDGKILQTQDGNVFNVQEESGFTVSGTNDSSAYATPYYSTDNGSTWIEIPRGSFTLPAMTTFKLKIGGYADNLMSATSTQLGLSLPLVETTVQISNNYILTQNITDLTIHRETA